MVTNSYELSEKTRGPLWKLISCSGKVNTAVGHMQNFIELQSSKDISIINPSIGGSKTCPQFFFESVYCF